MNFDMDHLAPPRDRQFVSIGGICELLQCMPSQIGTLMEAADVSFAQVVDGVPFLDIASAEKVAEQCRDVRQEIAQAESATELN